MPEQKVSVESVDMPVTVAVAPRRINWGSASLAIVMAFASAVCAGIVLWKASAASTSTGALAASLLFGVLTFFFALASLISVFHAVGLDNRNFALGMPRGSVRAFMALVLIMLFFLMSVFLYLDVAGTSREIVQVNVSASDLAGYQAAGTVLSVTPELDSEGVLSDPTTYRVRILFQDEGTGSQVAQDLARQLITVLGTLIVAIAAFYFGSNSVQAARDATAAEYLAEDSEALVREAVKIQFAEVMAQQMAKQAEVPPPPADPEP